ncbi:hypothetical protein F5X68DRAFT_232234 [Plectosphaerella plurivora]|uniref:Uncharacterized protein n=1 Tax=Plectosphaerella plurivora TaxID=936078 RepID=A0A9P8VCG1_9PEZI|nr:hypothetical protein F5X68DRAFT_232234 [Plectosphaerella plurivora]
MDEEPRLPRLPIGVKWTESQGIIRDPNFRKRGRRDSNESLRRKLESSDPAIFSSDDDPAIDNYAHGARRKRRYVGSWFHQQPLPSSSDSAFEEPITSKPLPKTRRTFKRQLDSGVWLGSDSTDDGFDALQIPKKAKLPVAVQQPVAAPKPVISELEREAQRIIQLCLDEGNETVDLSAMGLESLSAGTIKPLNAIVPIPLVAKDVPFEQTPPSIKLILARNPFLQMPSAICDIENLTLLSLRGCGLKELPPGIGRLTKLQTLNLAQNQLTSLPGELLNLLSVPAKLQDLFLQGNNFRKPAVPSDEEYAAHDKQRRLAGIPTVDYDSPAASMVYTPPSGIYECIGARFLGSSPVEYSDSTSRRISEFSLDAPLENNSIKAVIPGVVTGENNIPYHAVTHTPPPKASAVPSLLELAARSCYRSSDLEQLVDYLPESLPGPRKAVQRAIEQRAKGGQECVGCGKTMITPTAQWLEWWQVMRVIAREGETQLHPWSEDKEEQAIPFLRKGCTWKCVPTSMSVNGWMGGIMKFCEDDPSGSELDFWEREDGISEGEDDTLESEN